MHLIYGERNGMLMPQTRTSTLYILYLCVCFVFVCEYPIWCLKEYHSMHNGKRLMCISSSVTLHVIGLPFKKTNSVPSHWYGTLQQHMYMRATPKYIYSLHIHTMDRFLFVIIFRNNWILCVLKIDEYLTMPIGVDRSNYICS